MKMSQAIESKIHELDTFSRRKLFDYLYKKRNKSQGQNRERRVVMHEIQRDDLNCAICYSLIAEPTITPCEHLFCLSCIEKCMSIKNKCALCRQPFNDYVPEVDKDLQKYIADKFPDEFQVRKTELVAQGLWYSNQICIQLQYGNDWREIYRQLIGVKNYEIDNEWTMYLKTPNDPNMINKIVESVTFQLHPTFKFPVITINKAPWKQTKTSYGYFDIDMIVRFKKWTKLSDLELTHELCFEENGKHEKAKVFIGQDTLAAREAQLTEIRKNGLTNKEDKVGLNNQKKTLKKTISFKRWN